MTQSVGEKNYTTVNRQRREDCWRYILANRGKKEVNNCIVVDKLASHK